MLKQWDYFRIVNILIFQSFKIKWEKSNESYIGVQRMSTRLSKIENIPSSILG